MKKNYSASLILYNIRSIHNVGSIFRTADAASIKNIFLTGYTPHPVDRFGRKRPDLAKIALGAEESVPWEGVEDIFECIEEIKKNDCEIVSIEQTSSAADYKNFLPTKDTVFILGNEVDGIPENVLKKSDHVIEIKMSGKKESLNVSVAAGVVLFRVLDL